MKAISSRIKSFRSNDSGQSIVELALVSPLLILLLVGAVDLGSFMYGGIEVGNAARAGVHYGAQSAVTGGDTTGITAATQSDAKQVAALSVGPPLTYCVCDSNQGVQVSCLQTSPVLCPSPDRRDLFLQVTASMKFTPILRYPGLPNSLTISRTATQQILN